MANPISYKIGFTCKLLLIFLGTIVVGAINAPRMRAQSQQSPLPKFEVASIKPCKVDDRPSDGGRGGGGVLGDPGMFRTPCVTVRFLIQEAYILYANGGSEPVPTLKKEPLQGGPEWIDSERYTVTAKPETPQTRAMMGGPMLQNLLEDTFRLKIHRMTKEVPVYALVVAKGGPHLQVTKEGGCAAADSTQARAPIVAGQPLPCGYIGAGEHGDEMEAVGVTMAGLCQIFSVQLHRPIIDKTGLTGLFNYHVPFVTPPPGAPEDEEQFGVAIGALQRLGLKVEPTKGRAEFVVIDQIERPKEN